MFVLPVVIDVMLIANLVAKIYKRKQADKYSDVRLHQIERIKHNAEERNGVSDDRFQIVEN